MLYILSEPIAAGKHSLAGGSCNMLGNADEPTPYTDFAFDWFVCKIRV